jgi:hypothetical protein
MRCGLRFKSFLAALSPLHDKGHPIFGVFVHGRSFLEFWTPKVPLLKSPGDSKIIWGKKKAIKTTPKKGHEHCLLCWPAGVKNKVGVEQEKVGHVRLANA